MGRLVQGIQLLGTTAGLLLACTSEVYAQYTFSDTCAPESVYDISVLQPNVLMILDRSGSMNNGSGEDVDGGGEDSRFKVAKLVIQDLATANHNDGGCPSAGDPGCDDVRLGLGYYAGSSVDNSPDSLDSYVAVPPGDETRDPIIASVSTIDAPGGTGTTTGDAAARIRLEMTDDSRTNYGVIITDGATTEDGQQRKAITQLCAARDRATAPVTTYIVGFGTSSNATDNSFLAAAGGSGRCCEGTSPPCAVADRRDPCDADPSTLYNNNNTRTGVADGWTCEGSIEATGSDLKDALETVFAAADCTFALDIPPDYPEPSAQEDPDATRVRITIPSIAGGLLDLPDMDPASPTNEFAEYLENVWSVDPSVAAQYNGQGWYFADEQRVAVTFTDGLCDFVQSGDVTQVHTQVACICENTGAACTITAGYEGFTNEQIENMRCTAGIYECIDGEEVCVGSDDPLPEICNGVDDNCDGAVDNLDSGQMDWDAWEANPANDAELLHCNFSSVCGCPNGMTEPRAPAGASLQEHIDSWTGICTCGEGLAADSTASPDPTYDIEPQASCSATGGGLVGGLGLLLGFIAVGRRRR